MGYADENVLASYLHVHFGQRSLIASAFVRRMGGDVTEPDISSTDPG